MVPSEGGNGINRNVESRLSNQEWAKQYPHVLEWMERKASKHSQDVNLSILRGWCEWVSENCIDVKGLSPEQLLDYQWEHKDDRNGAYLLLEASVKYVKAHQGNWRYHYQRKVVSTIRSFFRVNKSPMPESREVWRELSSELLPAGEELKLTDAQKIILKSNEMYRAIFLSEIGGGMGFEEIRKWSSQGIGWLEKSLKSELYRREGIIRIDFPMRKMNKRPYWTYLGGDALEAMKHWMDKRKKVKEQWEREHTGQVLPATIFFSSVKKPLNYTTYKAYWIRKLENLGMIKRTENGTHGTRYGMNAHQLRDLFRTQFSRAPSAAPDNPSLHDKVANFMMGHDIDPLHYDKIMRDEEISLREYKKALPYLNVLTSDRAYSKVSENEVEDLRQQVKDLENQLAQQTENTKKIEQNFKKELEEKLFVMRMDLIEQNSQFHKALGEWAGFKVTGKYVDPEAERRWKSLKEKSKKRNESEE